MRAQLLLREAGTAGAGVVNRVSRMDARRSKRSSRSGEAGRDPLSLSCCAASSSWMAQSWQHAVLVRACQPASYILCLTRGLGCRVTLPR